MFKRNAQRTPRQKAEKAQLNILARLAGCAFLIYYVIKLLTSDETPSTLVAILIGIVFLGGAAFVIVINVMDFFRALKDGRFKASTYEEDDIAEYLERKSSESPNSTSEDDQPELDSARAPHEDAESEPDTEEKDSED